MRQQITIRAKITLDENARELPNFGRKDAGLDFIAAGLAAVGYKGTFDADGTFGVSTLPDDETK